MTNKLTAKLSDGREYEVVNDLSACFEKDSENRVMWLKPIKRTPREFVVSLLDGRIISCEPFDSGMTYNREKSIKVREVLE